MKLPPLKGIQRRKTDLEGVQHRDAELDYRKANVETRTVPATLSSEIPVKRWFGNEILRHTEDAVDLSRAADGLPLLFNHDSNVFIGAVRNVRVDEGKLRGDMVFSENSRADEVFKDVQAGLLRNVSIGYRIEEMEERKNGDVIATRWGLAEASIAPVPADPTVGINRKEDQSAMDNVSKSAEEVRTELINEQNAIRDLFKVRWQLEPEHVALRDTLIADGASIDEARKAFLDMLGMSSEGVGGANPESQKRGDNGNELARMMTEAVQCRAGTLTPEQDQKIRGNNEFTGLSLVEMARTWLRLHGHDHSGDAMTIVGRALSTRQETGDFPSILIDAAHNALLMAYWDAPESWSQWCRTGSLADFKINHRTNLSEFDTLPVVAEGATYTEGTFTDLGETIQLATYGRVWNITREAIINDSLSAFSRAPRAMGLAASRTVGNIAWNVITSNPAMSDTFDLFSANHNNDAAVGTAITADAVTAGKVAMALQQGPKNEATLGIPPGYLLTSVAKESEARTLMQAEYDPATTAGTLQPNSVRGLMTVVSDHRLDTDAAGPNQWYMTASPTTWDTVEVAFLNGNQTPFQERRQDDITNDNITYKVRIDCGAAALDWRGMYRNSGA